MRFRVLLIFGVLAVLSACSSVPVKHAVHVCPDSDTKLARINSISIVADVCLFRDVLGDDDYWSVQESQLAKKHMLEAAKTYLMAKGYAVSSVQAPFVGSFKNKEKPFRFAEEKGGEIREKIPPLAEADDLAGKPEYRQALLNVIPELLKSRGASQNLPTACCSSGEMKEHVGIIGSHAGGDATLFFVGHGAIVSAGKQLAQGLGTGLLTAALTLGTVSVYRYNVSWLDTYAILVDSTTGEILWSNAMRQRGDGFTDADYYDTEKWPKRILYYLPSKNSNGADDKESK
jgi:hypothetical protein